MRNTMRHSILAGAAMAAMGLCGPATARQQEQAVYSVQNESLPAFLDLDDALMVFELSSQLAVTESAYDKAWIPPTIQRVLGRSAGYRKEFGDAVGRLEAEKTYNGVSLAYYLPQTGNDPYLSLTVALQRDDDGFLMDEKRNLLIEHASGTETFWTDGRKVAERDIEIEFGIKQLDDGPARRGTVRIRNDRRPERDPPERELYQWEEGMLGTISARVLENFPRESPFKQR